MQRIRIRQESYIVDYAGFWVRLAALIIDTIIIVAIIRIICDYWRTATGVGWNSAAMRFLSYIISVLLFLTGLPWVAFDTRRQGVSMIKLPIPSLVTCHANDLHCLRPVDKTTEIIQ